MLAAKEGHLDVVQWLRQEGADIHAETCVSSTLSRRSAGEEGSNRKVLWTSKLPSCERDGWSPAIAEVQGREGGKKGGEGEKEE